MKEQKFERGKSCVRRLENSCYPPPTPAQRKKNKTTITAWPLLLAASIPIAKLKRLNSILGGVGGGCF